MLRQAVLHGERVEIVYGQSMPFDDRPRHRVIHGGIIGLAAVVGGGGGRPNEPAAGPLQLPDQLLQLSPIELQRHATRITLLETHRIIRALRPFQGMQPPVDLDQVKGSPDFRLPLGDFPAHHGRPVGLGIIGGAAHPHIGPPEKPLPEKRAILAGNRIAQHQQVGQSRFASLHQQFLDAIRHHRRDELDPRRSEPEVARTLQVGAPDPHVVVQVEQHRPPGIREVSQQFIARSDPRGIRARPARLDRHRRGPEELGLDPLVVAKQAVEPLPEAAGLGGQPVSSFLGRPALRRARDLRLERQVNDLIAG